MNLYDSIIKTVHEETKKAGVIDITDNAKKAWPVTEHSELVMRWESAFELGGGTTPSTNYTLVSTEDVAEDDGIFLVGPDIPDIKSDCAFARIVIIKTEEIGESEEAYNAIRNMEFARYHVFPKGYMVRVSSQSNQEQVRIGQDAIKKGINFSAVGKAYLEKYKAIEHVQNVQVIFITKKDVVESLGKYAKKADDITRSLTHIYDGLATDCGHCDFKPVCDEVEGMREMHLGMAKKKK
ncbi:MAG: carbon monoxide dehydrogenase [Lachnospiraceae bacterium]|nr:carbon monoxide dehydrogenase [Lachnospiraceae bacterium]